MAIAREEELYLPVKAFLKRQGYTVKAEVRGCDIVARRGDEPPVVVELKRSFTIALLLQGVDRLAASDHVYLAVAAPRRSPTWRRDRRAIVKLCRRIGLGLLVVHVDAALVEPLADPLPYRPRPNRRRSALLLKEFAARVGDPNVGGQTRRPIVTVYRQNALRCAALLHRRGPMKAALVAASTGVASAGAVLRRDAYGWFVRVERGIYGITPRGSEALARYADVVRELEAGA